MGCDRLLAPDGLYYSHGGEHVEIYLDLVVILNFFVDLLLLLGTNRLSGSTSAWGRLLGASALGALYSGVCLIPRLQFLGHPLWAVVCLGCMALIAFGINQSALRRGAVFTLLSMALGGLAVGFHRANFSLLILEAGLLWLICQTAFGGKIGGQSYVPLTITREGSRVSLTALVDTGNRLQDPISGESVMVISPDSARKLTGLTADQLSHPIQTMAQHPIPGLRLIPYRAVGSPGGMLLAMRFRDVQIGNRIKDTLIAFAPDGLGQNAAYQALIGGVI